MVVFLLMVPTLLGASDFDHTRWDGLLKKYVNQQSQVNYTDWKKTGAADLDQYLAPFEQPWPPDLNEVQRKAALINLYNAHTIRWMLAHYPVESIWKTSKPFTASRHRVDGSSVSLDEIETRLRKMGDPRVHAVLVCAARSCPPLRLEAYVPERLEQQLADNTRAWLGNRALNSFDPGKRVAEVSSIFKWYRQDFPSLEQFLATYGPKDQVAFLTSGESSIKFKDYRWGLNDTTELGSRYSGPRFWFDYLRNK